MTKMSKDEILACFKGVGQIEIPTRDMIVKTVSKARKEKKIPRPKWIMPLKQKKPSQSYLCNLNPRILKAEKLWRNLYAGDRASVLRSCGIEDNEEIVDLVNRPQVPDIIIEKFNLGR